MCGARYALAQELKATYENQAMKEWHEQVKTFGKLDGSLLVRVQRHKEEAEWQRRSRHLEAAHQQQMHALEMRHRSHCRSAVAEIEGSRSACNELQIKREKELGRCDNHWKQKIAKLKAQTATARRAQRPHC